MSLPTAVYSAPGKALLAGGYLVLFPEFSAFSVGLSSRMHAAAYPAPTGDKSGLTVRSPQFDSEWHFPSKEGTHKNPFLEACYEVVRDYFGFDIHGTVVVWSDAGFHSQKEAKQNHFPGNLSGFSYHGRPITEVPKTGLGSSAALVVAVIAAMAKLAVANTAQSVELSQYKLHNLSQIAHCVAQQKVGSGFDVATAIYGSIIYSRFAPDQIPSELSHETLVTAVDKEWDMRSQPCKLPKNVTVVMGDVSQGSETPGMVKNVLNWKNQNTEEASKLFKGLNEANMSLANALDSDNCDSKQVSDAIAKVRKYLQELTRQSGVPVEPLTQRELLDKASLVPGVLGGVVPGAGGDDAVCLLVDTSVESMNTIMGKLKEIPGVEWTISGLESIGLRSEAIDQYNYEL